MSNPKCSFCGQPKMPMIPGRGDRGVFICEGCIDTAGQRMAKVRAGQFVLTKSVAPAPPEPLSFTEREQAARARGDYEACDRIEQERRAAFFGRLA